jgi:hypothetical protein
MESAVGAGEMSQEEADRYLDRLRSGEHPEGLRARLRKHRPLLTGDGQVLPWTHLDII